MERKSKLIVDDTTIYEVDLDCFYCLPEEERWRYYDETLQRELKGQKKERGAVV